MAVFEEVGLVALRELSRNLRSKKGIAMFVLFFLGGAVPSLARIFLDRARVQMGAQDFSDAEKHKMVEQAMLLAYRGDHAIASYLADCPPVLIFLFQGTLVFLPLLVLMVGFDQVAGEIQHRGIRYLAGRANRHAIVIGKAIGVWGVVATMVLVLHLVVWAVMIVRGENSVGLTLSWGVRFYAFSVASAGAYVGLINLISSWFKNPILALFTGAGIAFGLWLAHVIVLLMGDDAKFATYVFPSTYETFMVSPEPTRAIGGVALSIVWGAVLIAAATLIVRRRDI